jgi:hypothetical protein
MHNHFDRIHCLQAPKNMSTVTLQPTIPSYKSTQRTQATTLALSKEFSTIYLSTWKLDMYYDKTTKPGMHPALELDEVPILHGAIVAMKRVGTMLLT